MCQKNNSNSINIPISKKTLKLQFQVPLTALVMHLRAMSQLIEKLKTLPPDSSEERNSNLEIDLSALAQPIEGMLAFSKCIIEQATETSTANKRLDQGKWLSILIVDDDERIQKFHRSMLESINCSTNFASNGYEALSMVQHEPYDVILMDIQMPGIDGIETAKKIRQLGFGFQTTPIIAITGTSLNEVREKTEDQIFNSTLEKPINIEKLQETLSLLTEKQI